LNPTARAHGRAPRVAFTAPPAFPQLHDDWPLQRAALEAAGLEVAPMVWSDPAADWAAFDLVVANGAWDNIHHVEAFVAWVRRVGEELAVPLVNNPGTLRWNLDKHYLRDLEADGVRIVPTQWSEPEDHTGTGAAPPPVDLAGEVVVKPAISGGGFQTARYEVHEHDAARAHIGALAASGRAAMVQPYQPAVDEEGETGLVFLGGTFSHAIHKEPMIRRGTGPRESLIENQVVTAATATPAQLELGRRAVAAAEARHGPTAYARVDTVRGPDGAPALLELELLDPVLFLTTDPPSAERFARVVAGFFGMD
jgi:glutathione synthase/RimK-type ligase-like ATP-grasp enzyme